MPRYIEANDLVRAMTLQANRSAFGEIAPPQLSYSEMLEIIADAPTADVVPKSEVKKWFRECEELQGRMIELESDVAREIFEEIDTLIVRRMIADSPFIDDRLIRDITKLKKKYTEGENQCAEERG